MIEFSEKEKRNNKEISQFILSFSKRQITDLSKLNISSFSDFLEDKEEGENSNRKNGQEVPGKENCMLEEINFLNIKFPFYKNSILNDINGNNIDINETKIKSFIYN